MKFIFKLLMFLLVFILSVLIFFPKQSAYNFLEHELFKEKLIISGEKRIEKAFSLTIKDGDVYLKGINVANINKASFTSYLVYTKVQIKDIRLLESLKSIFPTPISSIKLKHSILEFDKVKISANGVFGNVNGSIDIINRIITLELYASSEMRSSYSKILSQMKLKEGRYFYEYRY